ncbi:uncharacterized protein A4U43_C03F2120 [Asparagus officinalis]|uniref:Uncharacterized protein n=1 Tax=Asparagus officinalis TaxID=4686 RepID=A0A5P1F6M6_ASPOF|nr:uncharacterized protein A4U43_C03F2120 [Asparagus officinalis]
MGSDVSQLLFFPSLVSKSFYPPDSLDLSAFLLSKFVSLDNTEAGRGGSHHLFVAGRQRTGCKPKATTMEDVGGEKGSWIETADEIAHQISHGNLGACSGK